MFFRNFWSELKYCLKLEGYKWIENDLNNVTRLILAIIIQSLKSDSTIYTYKKRCNTKKCMMYNVRKTTCKRVLKIQILNSLISTHFTYRVKTSAISSEIRHHVLTTVLRYVRRRHVPKKFLWKHVVFH